MAKKVEIRLISKSRANKVELDDNGDILITFADGAFNKTPKRVFSTYKAQAEVNFEKMGSGKMDDIFGAIYMGTRNYKGDFLRDVVAYHKITDPENEMFGGFAFYKEKE